MEKRKAVLYSVVDASAKSLVSRKRGTCSDVHKLIWCLLVRGHISCAGRPRGHTARNQVRQFRSAETSRSHISGRPAAVSSCLELPHS